MKLLPRHELNQGFQWQVPPGPYRLVNQDQIRSWSDNGYFLMEDVFDASTIERLIEEIDPLEAAVEELLRSRGGQLLIGRAGEITFTNDLVSRSPMVRDFVRGPVFQNICHDLVGPDARLYWDMAVYKKPGTDKWFPWHQDNAYTFVMPQQYVTCWIALVDATLDNGCPWVIPSVHLQGTLTHRATDVGLECVEGEPDGAVAVPVKAGSIAVISSLTPHATGPNVTTGVRKALVAQFVPEGAKSGGRDKDGRFVWRPCGASRQVPILRGGRPAA
jgi:hypothetical protein